MSSGTYTIVLPTCTGGGNGGAWSSAPLNLPWPANVTSVTIQGQTTVSCTGTAGTPGYVCTAVDNTVIQDNYQGLPTYIVRLTLGGANTFFRMTGISFLGGTATNTPTDAIFDFVGGSHNFRIDHTHWDHSLYTVSGTDPLAMRMYGDIQGVLDHNLFKDKSGTINEWVNAFNSGLSDGYGDAAWGSPTGWGTSAFIFLEQNQYIQGAQSNCYNGGRIVARYNTMETDITFTAAFVVHETGGGGDVIEDAALRRIITTITIRMA